MSLEPGATFGRYQLAELLGRGGMGEVYSAHDSVLHRKVALKVLTVRPEADAVAGRAPSSTDRQGRILREARSAAGITHPNAVAIYDVGEVDGVPFLAMELVAGRNLRAFVGDTSVPLARRIRWIADVARALGAAHKLGIVHRDIKPENVMVRDDGFVKVLDFGIARRAVTAEDAPQSPPDPNDLAALARLAVSSGTLTAEGVVIGTPMYMAPEQIRAGAIDGRADQFAWGVLATEVLTGKTPWDGEGVAIFSQVLSREVEPLTLRNREIPTPVDAVVRKALNKLPDARFHTMEEIAEELEPFAATGATTTTGKNRISIPARGIENAATEQISATAHTAVQSAFPARTQESNERAKSGRAPVLIAAVAIAAAVAGVVGVRARAASQTAKQVVVDAGPPADVPSQMSNNRDATAAYLAGMQALRDGAQAAALTQLGRATELDPLFGAAQLRLFLTNLMMPDVATITSADLQAAHAAQASLGTHDHTLLDAFESVAREPPDYGAGRKILEAAVQKYLSDGDFPFQLGLLLDFAGLPTEAVKAVEISMDRDATFATAWDLKGLLRSELGDPAGAMNAYSGCMKASPRATACLMNLAYVEVSEGKCEDAVATARRLIPLEPPELGRPYYLLAQGLAGSGEPEEAVRAALQQYLDRVPAPSLPLESLVAGGALAILRGDFRAAEDQYAELERLHDTHEQIEFEASYPRMLLNLELGRSASVIRIAEAYLRQRAGLSPSDRLFGSLAAQAAERAAGGLIDAGFTAARDRWLALTKDADPMERWIEAYARPAETPEEASAALAEMPDASASFSLTALQPRFAEPVGRTLALAGRLDQALPYLVAASSSCFLLAGTDAIHAVEADFELGRALEERDDPSGACRAYKRVLARWGKASPPPRTAAKARNRERALGCAP